MIEPLKEGQDVSCVPPFLNFMRAESHGGRWKWGSSNVTGKVDEVVHEGQAQVQSDKVRMPILSTSICGFR